MASSTANKRVRLSLEKKQESIQYVKSVHSHLDASKKFQISRTAVTKMMGECEKIQETLTNEAPNKKRKVLQYTTKFNLIEEILYRWHLQKKINAPSLNVTGEALQTQAKVFRDRLLKEANILSNENLVAHLKQFNASSGWLYRYLNRTGVRSRRRCGEHSSVDLAFTEASLQRIRNQLEGIALNNIWNLDETALQFRTTSSRSYVTINSDGRGVKRSKERITITPIVSASGERLHLQVIGKSKNPRALKGIDINSTYKIVYESQTKAWQDGSTMLRLFHRINQVAKSRKSTFYILLDNCSSHVFAAKVLDPNGSQDSSFKYESIVILFFPPNATSDCQPLDQGIIRSLKAGFRKSMLGSLLQEYEKWQLARDESSDTVFPLGDHTHLRNALAWLKTAYASVHEDLIRRCFIKSRCLPMLSTADANADTVRLSSASCFADQSVTELVDLLRKVQLSGTISSDLGLDVEAEVACSELLQLDDDEPTGTNIVDEESIIAHVLNDNGIELSHKGDQSDDDDEDLKIVSAKDASQALSVLQSYLSVCGEESECAGLMTYSDLQALLQSLERCICKDVSKEKLKNARQSSLDQYFHPI